MSGWFEYGGRSDGGRRWWRRLVTNGGFRSSQLSPAGWLAVVGPGIGTGALVALMVGASLVPVMVVGAVMSWALALAIDTMAWRKVPIGITIDDLDDTQATEIVAALKAKGVRASIRADVDDEGRTTPVLRTVNRHRKAALRAVERHR
ncbi:MAG: hypothetical protein ACFCVK_02715 [Acidimicrobiales bacterium]